jgi:hypothetical protein
MPNCYLSHSRKAKKTKQKKGEGGNEKVEGNKYTALASNIRSKIIIQRNVTGEENELAESTNSIPLSAAPHNLLSIMYTSVSHPISNYVQESMYSPSPSLLYLPHHCHEKKLASPKCAKKKRS